MRPFPARQFLGQRQPARRRAVGIAGRIGEDDDRRLQAFGAVHGHHPHQPSPAPSLALEFALACVEPADEALQARGVGRGKGQRGVEQFVDRVVGLAPEPRDELAAPLPRSDQHPVQQRLRRLEIGPAQQVRSISATPHRSGFTRLAQVVPQRRPSGR